jgi:hypothetical protein
MPKGEIVGKWAMKEYVDVVIVGTTCPMHNHVEWKQVLMKKLEEKCLSIK